jgi:hypothetical protein
MKNLRRVASWIVVVAFVMLCAGCASEKVVKEEPPVQVVPYVEGPLTTMPVKPRETDMRPGLKPSDKESPKEVPYFVHTVKWRGETIAIIAGWYTGDIMNWKAIAEINPEINPRRISAGNKILVPEHIMKTHDPMPKEYVDNFYKSSKDPSKASPPAQKEEPTPLFGPRGLPDK